MAQAYERTIDRRKYLEQYATVVEKWECEVNAEIAANDVMRQFFTDSPIDPPMSGRGGMNIIFI
jgi:hypothetical protein